MIKDGFELLKESDVTNVDLEQLRQEALEEGDGGCLRGDIGC